jgi:hypothetical protein
MTCSRTVTLLFCVLVSSGATPAAAQVPEANELVQQVLVAPPEEQAALQNSLLSAALPLSDDLAALAVDPSAEATTRALAFWFVGESADETACELLALPAETDQPGLLFAASLGLARCGDGQPLRDLLRHADAVLRLKAAVTLGLLMDSAALADIVALGEDPALEGYRVFIDVARGLLGDGVTEPVLRALLTERTFRDHAAIALARMGDSSVAFELGFAYRSPDPMIREAAVQAAARTRTGNAETLLDAALTDPSARLADWAGRALRWYSHGRLPDDM